jgi:hypothetical protein
MVAKALKWQVNTALRSSRLPPPSRLIMFVMSDLADSHSGIIISALTPSLRELAEWTGLGKATVKRHRDELIASGWLLYRAPSAADKARHKPGAYRIALGSEGSPRTPGTQDAGAHSEPSEDNSEEEYGPDPGAQSEPSAGAQSEHPEEVSGDQAEPPSGSADEGPRAQSELSEGSERALAGAQSEPSYIEDYYQDDLTTKTLAAADAVEQPAAKPKRAAKPKTAKPPPDPRNAEAREIVGTWWDQLTTKPSAKHAFIASVGIVEGLLAAGHKPDAVADAARAIGVPITINRMEIQLGRARAGHQPYRNPDPAAYDDESW